MPCERLIHGDLEVVLAPAERDDEFPRVDDLGGIAVAHLSGFISASTDMRGVPGGGGPCRRSPGESSWGYGADTQDAVVRPMTSRWAIRASRTLTEGATAGPTKARALGLERHVRRELDDVRGCRASARSTRPAARAALSLVHQQLRRLLPSGAFELRCAAVNSSSDGVAALAPRDDHELVRVGHARDRLLLGPGLALRQHVDLPVLVREPRRRRSGACRPASKPTQITSDFFSPSSVSLGSFSAADCTKTGNSISPTICAVEDERGDERAGLVEHRVVDPVELGREVHGAHHAARLGAPPVDRAARGSDQPDLLAHEPRSAPSTPGRTRTGARARAGRPGRRRRWRSRRRRPRRARPRRRRRPVPR